MPASPIAASVDASIKSPLVVVASPIKLRGGEFSDAPIAAAAAASPIPHEKHPEDNDDDDASSFHSAREWSASEGNDLVAVDGIGESPAADELFVEGYNSRLDQAAAHAAVAAASGPNDNSDGSSSLAELQCYIQAALMVPRHIPLESALQTRILQLAQACNFTDLLPNV